MRADLCVDGLTLSDPGPGARTMGGTKIELVSGTIERGRGSRDAQSTPVTAPNVYDRSPNGIYEEFERYTTGTNFAWNFVFIVIRIGRCPSRITYRT
jgi:hypothetical protein